MTAYYNEIDPFAAQWLRNLISAGHIAPGFVDERSIEDVHPSDLRGFTQCHFFAGLGAWSYALRGAGWSDDRPVWTGSCPCQPFSTAGKGAGFADERHLWPAFFHLISECAPAAIFGEQVASKDVEPWIDLVQSDVEEMGYAFGCVAFPSAGVGAPHIRDRAYWLAYSERWAAKRYRHPMGSAAEGSGGAIWEGPQRFRDDSGDGCAVGRMGHADGERLERLDALLLGQDSGGGKQDLLEVSGSCEAGGLADLHQERRGRGQGLSAGGVDDRAHAGRLQSDHGSIGGNEAGLSRSEPAGPVNGPWRDADWLLCRDGKFRPVEPGTFPLAHGTPGRVGRLRAYGNAINAEAAKVFIECSGLVA